MYLDVLQIYAYLGCSLATSRHKKTAQQNYTLFVDMLSGL